MENNRSHAVLPALTIISHVGLVFSIKLLVNNGSELVDWLI